MFLVNTYIWKKTNFWRFHLIDNSANPLAEVALALAMAFFSLMVLTLFAVVHQPQHTATEDLTIAHSTSETQTESPKLVIMHETGLFDDMLRPIDASDLPVGAPITLAVWDDLTIADMMSFQQANPTLDIKISTLTPEWTNLLMEKIGKAK